MDQVTINVTEIVENVTVIAGEMPVLPFTEVFLNETIYIPGNPMNWVDVISLELAAGKYMLFAHVIFGNATNFATAYMARLCDQENELAVAQNHRPGMALSRETLSLTAIVTLEYPTTIMLQVSTSSSLPMNASVIPVIDNGTANVATGIHAVKIGYCHQHGQVKETR